MINRVIYFLRIRLAQAFEELVKRFAAFVLDLEAYQNRPVVGALVALLKQADVPRWALGEFKSHQAFVF